MMECFGKQRAGGPGTCAAQRESTMTEHPVARRTVIKSAGLGLGAGIAVGIAPAHAQGAARNR